MIVSSRHSPAHKEWGNAEVDHGESLLAAIFVPINEGGLRMKIV